MVLKHIESDTTRVNHRVEYVERVRDTVVYVHLPAESRETTVRSDSSRLETSLAFSTARITLDGALHHTLENKIAPVAVQLALPEFRTVILTDTLRLSATVREVPVKMPLSAREKFLLDSGKALWIIIAGLAIVLLGRLGLRRLF
jgi:hypothetical protein